MVSPGLSVAKREIEVGHKLPGGVGWDECGPQRRCDWAQVTRKQGECRLRPFSWKNNVKVA